MGAHGGADIVRRDYSVGLITGVAGSAARGKEREGGSPELEHLQRRGRIPSSLALAAACVRLWASSLS
jgi:hypothetical protein